MTRQLKIFGYDLHEMNSMHMTILDSSVEYLRNDKVHQKYAYHLFPHPFIYSNNEYSVCIHVP